MNPISTTEHQTSSTPGNDSLAPTMASQIKNAVSKLVVMAAGLVLGAIVGIVIGLATGLLNISC